MCHSGSWQKTDGTVKQENEEINNVTIYENVRNIIKNQQESVKLTRINNTEEPL